MCKCKTASKKLSKQQQRKSVRAKASAYAAKLAKATNSTLPGNTPKQDSSTNEFVTDTALFPTEDNGNSHKQSYLQTATKLAEEIVTEKRKTSSFHIVRDILTQPSTILNNDTIIPNKSQYTNI